MSSIPVQTASARLGTAEIAVALAEVLSDGGLIFAAEAEAEAIAVAQALSVAAPDAAVILLPESDALSGDEGSASPANIGRRNAALTRLRELVEQKRGRAALIATAEAFAYAYPAPRDVGTEPLSVALGAAIELTDLLASATALGYVEDDRVDEPGEVALRGQVLDIFPAQNEGPIRVEVIDCKVVGIRSYDLLDQRTVAEIDAFTAVSLLEPPLGKARCSLLDHFPDARIVFSDRAEARRQRELALASEIDSHDGRLSRRLLSAEVWKTAMGQRTRLSLERQGKPPQRFVEGRAPVRAFSRAARAAIEAGERLVLLGSARDLRFLSRRARKLLGQEVVEGSSWSAIVSADPGSVLSLPMPCDHGFRREGILAVAAADLLGSRAERADAIEGDTPALLDVAEIRVGDVVVHEDHGLGLVAGIEALPAAGGEADAGDAIRLTYADDGVHLVPVSQAHRIWRYGAEADAVTLDRLDGSSWRRRKDSIAAAVAQTARGLAALAADRANQVAPVLEADASAYERFSAGFPFSETPDQARAIEAVRDDLAAGKPMDRLVIGDVGFGKTEVALRAAAIAVLAGKQVAVAAPTTVLARQHVETFTRRFAGLDVNVRGLHRLMSASDKKAVKQGLADGTVDIVIGTGAVAGKGVAYKDLALVIIDEEQRFGTADKQKLRGLGAGHVLTLTATPIPRTLQNALVGLQQLSIIATPPARRLPIRTAVAAFDAAMIRAALMRERSRSGQSFVVVPRISDMAAMSGRLRDLLPGFEILEAHGKLPAAEIDEAMIRFSRGEGDVLLATNIIEAGLDVPRANTMIVCKADRFGLAQLHQLRGRVGRGNRRGHMLMLTEADKAVPERTLKRLRTLEALNHLGAGFEISARDLDLRGAGDLLGETQAGHMKLIGVDLYQQLLADALREISEGQGARWTPELQVGVEGKLPQDWIADQDTRLSIYMRLARLDDPDGADLLEEELEDRFGDVPREADLLLAMARLRANAREAGVSRVVAGPTAIAIYPRDGRDLAPEGWGLDAADGCFILREAIDDAQARLGRVMELIASLADQATG